MAERSSTNVGKRRDRGTSSKEKGNTRRTSHDVTRMEGRLSSGELASLHSKRAEEIQERLRDFARVPPEEYFYECIYCLLTPQTSAENAEKAVRKLREESFQERGFNPEEKLHSDDFYIRFHKTKAQNLIQLRQIFAGLMERLGNNSGDEEMRKWLVKNVRGMGWKEASHFLRNIGRKDLAILDRHILRHLVRAGVLRKIPKTLTPKKYQEIEKKFRRFSQKCGISMDELDLLFWSMATGKVLK